MTEDNVTPLRREPEDELENLLMASDQIALSDPNLNNFALIKDKIVPYVDAIRERHPGITWQSIAQIFFDRGITTRLLAQNTIRHYYFSVKEGYVERPARSQELRDHGVRTRGKEPVTEEEIEADRAHKAQKAADRKARGKKAAAAKADAKKPPQAPDLSSETDEAASVIKGAVE